MSDYQTPGLQSCRSCHGLIYWLYNDNTGKRAPIDAAPRVGGNVSINVAAGTYHVIGRPRMDASAHTNHFQTCPHAPRWRDFGKGGRIA